MSHIKRHGKTGMYWYRRAVPKKLRSIVGKCEWNITLGTKDPDLAKRIMPDLEKRIQEEIDTAELKLATSRRDDKSDVEGSLLPAVASNAHSEAMTRSFLAMGQSGFSGQSVIANDHYAAITAFVAAMSGGRYRLVPNDGGTPAAIATETIPTVSATVSEPGTIATPANQSDPIFTPPTPEVTTVPLTSAHGPSVKSVWESYIRREKPSSKTAGEFRTAWEIFFQATGYTWDSPLSAITRPDIRGFRDLLLGLPANYTKKNEYKGVNVREIFAMVENDNSIEKQKSQTINKKLCALRTVFGHGMKEFDLPINPVSMLSVLVDDSEDGRPFSTVDLETIFSNDRFTGQAFGAEYWLPILALYTGARLGELGQLYVSDIRHEFGVDYIDINDDGPDKSLKNRESKRVVPIHPELNRLGFLEFVQKQKSCKCIRLFTELSFESGQGYTKNYSRDFGRFRDRLGIQGIGLKFHSFRHNFKDAAREAEIPQEIYDVIQGHSASKNVGSKYGTGFSLTRLSREIARIKYPVDMLLQRVYS